MCCVWVTGVFYGRRFQALSLLCQGVVCVWSTHGGGSWKTQITTHTNRHTLLVNKLCTAGLVQHIIVSLHAHLWQNFVAGSNRDIWVGCSACILVLSTSLASGMLLCVCVKTDVCVVFALQAVCMEVVVPCKYCMCVCERKVDLRHTDSMACQLGATC